MISNMESNCYVPPKTNVQELTCEQFLRIEHGIGCFIGPESHFKVGSSHDYEIVSHEYPRVQSLAIVDYKNITNQQKERFIEFLPVSNSFTRNVIGYIAWNTKVKTIAKKNFGGMIWLEQLVLYSNLIETIPKDTFQGLGRLKQISLGK